MPDIINGPKAAVFTWSALQARRRYFTPYTPAAFVTDWLINCAAILFALTSYSKSPLILNGLLLLPALTSVLSGASQSGPSKRPNISGTKSSNHVKHDGPP